MPESGLDSSEITELEYADATMLLAHLGVRGHYDYDVAFCLLNYLGRALELMFMERPYDAQVRGALAAYRAWVRLPDHAPDPASIPTNEQLERVIAHLREMDGPCCVGRPAGHTGKCWPAGATHPAAGGAS